MKPTLFIILVAAAAGFLAGWLAKPTAAEAPPPITETPPTRPLPKPATPKPGPAPVPAPVPPSAVPKVVPPGVAPQADGAREAAKMQRLAEVLDLDEETQAKLQKILDDSAKAFTIADPTKPLSSRQTLEVLATAAGGLKQALDELLTPEQATKFAALRQRERANRIETRAQKDLGRLCEITDLDPAQCEQILPQLRARHTADLEQVPAAYALWIESPVLPLGPRALPEESILTLIQLAASDTAQDPSAERQQVFERQRQRLDQQLEMLRPLVSPAQLAQFEAASAQQRAIQERMWQPPKP